MLVMWIIYQNGTMYYLDYYLLLDHLLLLQLFRFFRDLLLLPSQ